MRKNNLRLLAAIGLSLNLSLAGTAPAWAAAIPAGPGSEAVEVPENLKDNILEYEELPDLIGYYNVDVVNTEAKLTNSENLDVADELRAEARSLAGEAATLKEEGLRNGTNRALYEQYKENVKALNKTARGLEESSEPSHTNATGLRQLKASQTMLAQTLMIDYQKLQDEKVLADKNAELAAAQYNATVRKQQIGRASAAEVTAAEQSMKSAQAEAVGKQKELDDTKYNLCMMTGWDYNALPEIRPVPQPDSSRIEGMNPSADLEKAIGNSFSLQDIRHVGASGRANRRIRTRNLDQGEQSLAVTLQSLYDDIFNKKSVYEAACSAFEAAQTSMNAADKGIQIGSLSNLEYLEKQSEYLTAKSEKTAAELDYFWAMETYDWAVDGLVSSGGQ